MLSKTTPHKRASCGVGTLGAMLIAGLLAIGTAAHAGSVQVLNTLPHNRYYFTQGLVVHQGRITETTGNYGQSVLATYIAGEEPTVHLNLAPQLFGEGITAFKGDYYWLSWKSGTAFRINSNDFSLKQRYSYRGEGWGITHNGKQLIMSDGSATLRVKDPATFETQYRVNVTENGEPLSRLNELEYVDGAILANIWRSDRIVKIDPNSGNVLASYDLSSLREHFSYARANVLNGIAYDSVTGKLYVTGKNWPLLFEVKLLDTAPAS